jgi:hypothetical protein
MDRIKKAWDSGVPFYNEIVMRYDNIAVMNYAEIPDLTIRLYNPISPVLAREPERPTFNFLMSTP